MVIPLSSLIVTVPLSSPSPSPASQPAHHLPTGGFHNPWPSFRPQAQGLRFLAIVGLIREMWKNKVPPNISVLLPVVKPNWGEGQAEKTKATWLGHACFLVELPTPKGAARGARILFDPVFSHRCSPVQWIGPARYTPPPCKIEDIPQVDAVVISHNHYDHMDTHTLQTLRQQKGGPPHIFAPLANDAYFQSLAVPGEDWTCMDWWEQRECTVLLPSQAEEGEGAGGVVKGVEERFRLTCTPCQHFTGRSLSDRFKTLWASWALESIPSSQDAAHAAPAPVKIWFAGDTGYRAVPDGMDETKMPVCPVFKDIGARFGGFDLALIPIGAYLPRQMMSPVHCAPQDSALLFRDVQARRGVGMHWGTWMLTTEKVMDPPQRLKEECEKVGIGSGRFTACESIGETVLV
ncbi:Metallo-hydrolase/oxidoreductase [Dacryopinax primogenitus]|uniref:Metallo-hydrolase/oxidoreductase n=1 Tax=Dacryopinax primogenitus (strain DJM 731) TaxID=1858805 RepID=M5FWL0_DACPD|nr:Metallo-hydrolase/oxidoreductase [Dacryopinax primogenitus]EJU02331.1 Metallo-hydrolase/oxidoreductase [Dacryopinax primogenitus]